MDQQPHLLQERNHKHPKHKEASGVYSDSGTKVFAHLFWCSEISLKGATVCVQESVERNFSPNFNVYIKVQTIHKMLICKTVNVVPEGPLTVPVLQSRSICALGGQRRSCKKTKQNIQLKQKWEELGEPTTEIK